MDRDNFIAEIKGVTKSRNHKILHSYGIRDAHRYYLKHSQHRIPEKDFSNLIKQLNLLWRDNLLQGKDVKFPLRMGVLRLRKREAGVSIKNGKIINNFPVDWNETLKLWYEDPEAKEAKTVVKICTPYVFGVSYDKYTANYDNKGFFYFETNRTLKGMLKKVINTGKIDAYLKYGHTIHKH